MAKIVRPVDYTEKPTTKKQREIIRKAFEELDLKESDIPKRIVYHSEDPPVVGLRASYAKGKGGRPHTLHIWEPNKYFVQHEIAHHKFRSDHGNGDETFKTYIEEELEADTRDSGQTR